MSLVVEVGMTCLLGILIRRISIFPMFRRYWGWDYAFRIDYEESHEIGGCQMEVQSVMQNNWSLARLTYITVAKDRIITIQHQSKQ